MYFKIFLCLVLVHTVACSNETDSNLDPAFLDLNQIKNEVFFDSDFADPKLNINLDFLKCFYELSRLQKSLKKYELWAFKGINVTKRCQRD